MSVAESNLCNGLGWCARKWLHMDYIPGLSPGIYMHESTWSIQVHEILEEMNRARFMHHMSLVIVFYLF